MLGVLLEWLTRHRDLEHWMRFLVGVGALGAFTTFSTFMVETVELARDDHAPIAVGYVAASLVGGVIAVLAGLAAAGWRPGGLATVPTEGESP